MATYYYDSVNGNDANPGTIGSPKQTYTSVGTVVGDRFLFKAGTTQTFPSMATARSGSSDSARSYFGVYGASAQATYVTFRVASGAIILNGAGSKYITFEDIYFDMTNPGVLHSVYCTSQSVAGQTVGNIFRRCYFTGSNSGVAPGGGNGLNIQREPASTAASPEDYLIEDCHFWGNSGHGMLVAGGRNIIVRRCNFWGNGFDDPTGGHGFSSRALHRSAPSGWTISTGTIWQHTLAAPATDVYYVRTNVAAYFRLTRTPGAATAPGLGQYGVSGGVLYINVGSAANPSTQAITYVYALCSNLLIEDCNSWGNISDPRTPGTEGHGYAFDDYAENSIFRRNKSYDNEGAGFSINRGDSNTVASNIAFNNGGPGIIVNIGFNARIINNTLTNNNQGGIHARAGEVVFTYTCSDGLVTNNIVVGTKTYGIDCDPANLGFRGSNNNIYGAAKADRTGFGEGTITVNPMLDTEFRPRATALRRSGAYLGGKDFYAKQFYNPPNIGAVEDVTSTPRYAFLNRK